MSLLFLTMSLILSPTTIKEVVEEFHALKTKESEVLFVEKYTLSSQSSILGYVCAIEMKQAQYSYNPISKIKIFGQKLSQCNGYRWCTQNISLITSELLFVYFLDKSLCIRAFVPILRTI